MRRIERILCDSGYIGYMEHIRMLEEDRIFCHHDFSHMLDVCRIAWILNLEEDLAIDKETIYAAGLLHDIGRWKQYIDGEDHAKVSSRLADDILLRCGFSKDEIKLVQDAIASHRILVSQSDPGATEEKPSDLSRILYRADKLSRPCFTCQSIMECKNFKDGQQPFFLY